MFDFKKLGREGKSSPPIHPRDIFSVLPNKEPRFGDYLRDVQHEVLDSWFHRRDQKDTVIKMNTGGGKTVVGLLLLQSCLNELKGPALYVAPDNYLVSQVIGEARSLGLEVTEDINDPAYSSGRSIGVVNTHKLFNGKSIFGLSDEGIRKPIGSVVLDDVHASIDTIEGQFCLTYKRDHSVYEELLEVFRQELRAQSETRLVEIEAEYTDKLVLIPFWAWQNNQAEVARILRQADSPETMFKYPLIQDCLAQCTCTFGNGRVEIAPRFIPSSIIPSVEAARRRTYLTATLSDDNSLLKAFAVPPDVVEGAISPSFANDMGERLIASPQALSTAIGDEELRLLVKELSEKTNTVVIVPNFVRAQPWIELGAVVANKDDLAETIRELREDHVGLVVVVNRYDGIDLPDSACRVLVLDGVPQPRSLFEQLEQATLHDAEGGLPDQIRTIEQGMGRGSRSSSDYCVVILMGRDLVGAVSRPSSAQFFTDATRVQFELSGEVFQEFEGDLTGMRQVFEQVLNRDKNWISLSRERLLATKYRGGKVGATYDLRRRAFDAAYLGNYERAASFCQEAIRTEQVEAKKAWLRLELAEYLHAIDDQGAQAALTTSGTGIRLPIRPRRGLATSRLLRRHGTQAEACSGFLQERSNGNSLMIEAHQVLDDIRFIRNQATRFESALNSLAPFIGFTGSQPESESGRGPDNLWCIDNGVYLVIECKSGAEADEISSRYCNQLSGSMNWFSATYPKARATPIMIHPSKQIAPDAETPGGMRVLSPDYMANLVKAILGFLQGVQSAQDYGDVEKIARRLIDHKLASTTFVDAFTCVPKVSRVRYRAATRTET